MLTFRKFFSLPFFFCLWLMTQSRELLTTFFEYLIFTSCLRLRQNAQHPSDLWGTTKGKLVPDEWCLCLAMAVKFKDSPIGDLIPWGIIYGLRNKVVAKYLRNPLQKATRLCWYFLICIKSVPKGCFHCFTEVNMRQYMTRGLIRGDGYIFGISSSKLPSKWKQCPNKLKRTDNVCYWEILMKRIK